MREMNFTVSPENANVVTDCWTDDDPPIAVPSVVVITDPQPTGRRVLRVPDEAPVPQGPVGLNVLAIDAVTGHQAQCRTTLIAQGTQAEADGTLNPLTFDPPFIFVPPTRAQLLSSRLIGQGQIVESLTFGAMPWWPACWAWLMKADRAHIAPQLLNSGGDQVMLIALPWGQPLYNEPLPNFYNPDRFPALDWTNGGTAIDPALADLIIETLGYGFKGVWLFLGGDASADRALAQTQLVGPALTRSRVGNLNQAVVQLPGWDGTWHKPDPSGNTGYTPDQFAQFGEQAIAAGAIYLGMLHANGYEPVGGGAADFQPGGPLARYALILGQFAGDNFNTDDTWQILGRFIRPYNRPPEQPAWDDPFPPYYLDGTSVIYRRFEWNMYGAVRGLDNAIVRQQGDYLKARGGDPDSVCY